MSCFNCEYCFSEATYSATNEHRGHARPDDGPARRGYVAETGRGPPPDQHRERAFHDGIGPARVAQASRGQPPISTVAAPGGRIGVGAPLVAGLVIKSETRAAGSIFLDDCV